MLSAKLSIYDACILSKAMKESLIKALLNNKIFFASLTTIGSSQEELSSFYEAIEVTFLYVNFIEHSKS